ncbi:MAG TPA: hypothetical protein VID27_01865 [Blastocatellia bacterium]
MASLQARTPLRNTNPLLIINKFLSFTIFFALLVAGWLGLSYLKAEMSDPGKMTDRSIAAPPAEARDKTKSPEVRRLSTPVKLVYSCDKDRRYYHTSNHLPQHCEGVALSEEAALKRSLKPCPVCMIR